MKSILKNENVQLLIKTFDLKEPLTLDDVQFEACEMSYVKGTGIVIKKIKVLDKDGNYVKFAELSKVVDHLRGRTIKIK